MSHIHHERATHKKIDGILVRPRVNQLLAHASEHPLVTVTAGTGYGKSQAVLSYLNQGAIPNIWLQLTGLDNYPQRFWDLFCRAVGSKNARLGSALAGHGFPGSMEKSYRFLRLFSAEVYRQGSLVLVLDDFHKINDPSIIHFVETLCFTGIENLTIFLLSRQPLMLDYSALQTQNLIANIGIADLRFTEGEMQEYYEQAGHAFTPQQLANIYHSTEGWPLAIYLVGLHLHKDGRLFNDPVDCTIPLLYQLIELELYAAYPAPIQDIFVKLSLLESIPLNLVQALSGRLFADVATHLRQNMFVTYNPQTEHYHFHRLFRRFLREKQNQLTDDELCRLYLTIGDWYREGQKPLEALTFYAKCEHNARSWLLIRQFGSEGINNVFAHFCIEQLDSFTPEFIEANPLVRVMRAFLLLTTGEIELAYRHNLEILEEVETLEPTPARRELLGEVYIQLAHLSIMKGSYDFVDYFSQAAECLPNGSSIIHKNHFYVGSNSALNLFSTEAGALDRYVKTVLTVMPAATRVLNGCGTGIEQLAKAELHLCRAEFGPALQSARLAIDAAQGAKQYDIIFNAILVCLRVYFAQGDYEATFGELDRMHRQAALVDDQYLFGMDDIAEAWLYAHLGHPERIAGWILSANHYPVTHSPLNIGKEKVVHALCLLQRKDYYEMSALLDYMEKRYTAQGLSLLLLHVHILRAIQKHKLGDRPAALASFEKAYDIAYNNHIIMPFIEYDGDMRSLLEMLLLLPHGMDAAWMQDLHAKSSTYSKKRSVIAKEYERRNRIETSSRAMLSPREMEILKALCLGLTREEISLQLNISLNTVKTTLKSIFSKLGAINRADAIRIAKDYHLIE